MSPLTISLIQTDLHWENKESNLQMFEEKVLSIKESPHIIVLPEMFSTGFSMKPEALAETMDDATVEWMKKISREKKCIVTGSVIIKEEEHYYNRLIWMLPNGQFGKYDKRHRFAYAGEHEHYTAGNKRLIASVNGWKVNLLVCYDLRFPVWSRQQSNEAPEFDLMIYVANWPERRSTAWKTLLKARAIENQSYVVGVNRIGKDGNDINHSGDSMVIDPLGEILYHQTNSEDIHTITLQPDHLQEVRTKFPFWKDADHFQIIHE
jgi:omega-amidase